LGDLEFEIWDLRFAWDLELGIWDFVIHAMAERDEEAEPATEPKESVLVCPLCGSVAFQEKCKVICRSEICRGRVVLNCSEF